MKRGKAIDEREELYSTALLIIWMKCMKVSSRWLEDWKKTLITITITIIDSVLFIINECPLRNKKYLLVESFHDEGEWISKWCNQHRLNLDIWFPNISVVNVFEINNFNIKVKTETATGFLTIYIYK